MWPRGKARSWMVFGVGRKRVSLALFVTLMLGACATAPSADDPEAVAEFQAVNDPIEPFNRAVYEINNGINFLVMGPLGYGYRWAVPEPARHGIHNALDNANSPIEFANHLLQGNPCRAGDTLLRLVINSTFGLGGLVDLAKQMGIPAHTTDFGLTLGGWGIPEGPYLFVPLLGSTNPRDLVGSGVDLVADPWSWIVAGRMIDNIDWVRLGMHATDSSERWLDEVKRINRTSLDPYITYRSLYRGHRRYAVERVLDQDAGVVCEPPRK